MTSGWDLSRSWVQENYRLQKGHTFWVMLCTQTQMILPQHDWWTVSSISGSCTQQIIQSFLLGGIGPDSCRPSYVSSDVYVPPESTPTPNTSPTYRHSMIWGQNPLCRRQHNDDHIFLMSLLLNCENSERSCHPDFTWENECQWQKEVIMNDNGPIITIV